MDENTCRLNHVRASGVRRQVCGVWILRTQSALSVGVQNLDRSMNQTSHRHTFETIEYPWYR